MCMCLCGVADVICKKVRRVVRERGMCQQALLLGDMSASGITAVHHIFLCMKTFTSNDSVQWLVAQGRWGSLQPEDRAHCI